MAILKSRQEYSPTPLLYLMFVLQHKSEELLDDQVGAGLAQIRILGVLDRDAPHPQNQVAQHLQQTEANVSRQLRVMSRAGLVSIRTSKNDKRQRDVLLTAKGWRHYEKAKKLLHNQQKDLLKLLGKEDRKTFEHALENLIKSI